MATDWYYSRGGQQHGPVSVSELKQLAASGKLLPSDLVWKDGMDEWAPASKVKGLFSEKQLTPARHPAPPPPPPPTAPSSSPPPTETASHDNPQQPSTLNTKLSAAASSLTGFLNGQKAKAKAKGYLVVGTSSPPVPPSENVTAKPVLPSGLDETGVFQRVPATYIGGHPSLTGERTGSLFLTKRGIEFLSDEGGELLIRLKQLVEVLKPSKGSLPKDFLEQARRKQSAAKAGKVIAGLAGGMIGGVAGRAVKSVGQEAAGAAKRNTKLGPPPKNRVTVVDNKHHKVQFDVAAPTKEDMAEKAKDFCTEAQSVLNSSRIALHQSSQAGAARQSSFREELLMCPPPE